MSPLITQPSSRYPPPADAPDTPDSPPLVSHKDSSDAARLASESDLPGYFLTVANDNLFGVYQDWVHQNPGTHLYGGIE